MGYPLPSNPVTGECTECFAEIQGIQMRVDGGAWCTLAPGLPWQWTGDCPPYRYTIMFCQPSVPPEGIWLWTFVLLTGLPYKTGSVSTDGCDLYGMDNDIEFRLTD